MLISRAQKQWTSDTRDWECLWALSSLASCIASDTWLFQKCLALCSHTALAIPLLCLFCKILEAKQSWSHLVSHMNLIMPLDSTSMFSEPFFLSVSVLRLWKHTQVQPSRWEYTAYWYRDVIRSRIIVQCIPNAFLKASDLSDELSVLNRSFLLNCPQWRMGLAPEW